MEVVAGFGSNFAYYLGVILFLRHYHFRQSIQFPRSVFNVRGQSANLPESCKEKPTLVVRERPIPVLREEDIAPVVAVEAETAAAPPPQVVSISPRSRPAEQELPRSSFSPALPPPPKKPVIQSSYSSIKSISSIQQNFDARDRNQTTGEDTSTYYVIGATILYLWAIRQIFTS